MKIIASDSGHAALPDNLLSLYLYGNMYKKLPENIKQKIMNDRVSIGTLTLDGKVGRELSGLECILPASLMINRSRIERPKIRNYRRMTRRLEKRFGEEFGYYSFHALYEESPPILKEFNINLADNRTTENAKGIESIITDQIRIARMLSCVKKPILNMHMGWLEEEKYKEDRIKRLKNIINRCLEKQENITICFENAPTAEKGYNLFQKPEDFEMLREKGIRATYDISHLEVARFKNNDENLGFKDYHNNFIRQFKKDIAYMHWSFNDISLMNGEKLDLYYKEDRHSPPSRFKNTELTKDFEEVTKNAVQAINNNMGEKACMCVEVPRRKVFFKTYCTNGATEKELIESYKYAKRLSKEAEKDIK